LKFIKNDDVNGLGHELLKGIDINYMDVLEGAPIHCSIEHNSRKCFEYLIEQGANINSSTTQKNETPIHIAIRTNNNDIFEYLLELSNIDLTKKNNDGETPFFYAVKYNNFNMVKTLLYKGVDINEPNNLNYLPLYAAVSNRNIEIIHLLIDNNIDIENEVHSSIKLAEAMNDETIISILKEKTTPESFSRLQTPHKSRRIRKRLK